MTKYGLILILFPSEFLVSDRHIRPNVKYFLVFIAIVFQFSKVLDYGKRST